MGADNGIGVATELAILADDSIEHGPIAVSYTHLARGEAFNAPIVRFTRSAVVMVCVYSSICTVPPIETAEL